MGDAAVADDRGRARRGLPPERPDHPGGFVTGPTLTGPDATLLEVENLVTRYPMPRSIMGALKRAPKRTVHAVEGVSFSLARGEMLALVGESGCGKTTTAQTVLRMVDPVSGSIRFQGQDV